jgi:hypothetical protein
LGQFKQLRSRVTNRKWNQFRRLMGQFPLLWHIVTLDPRYIYDKSEAEADPSDYF